MKVISIVTNNFVNDSRVLKEAITLKKAGYDINVVALHEKDLKEKEIVGGIKVNRIKIKSKEWSKNTLIQLVKYVEFSIKVIKQFKEVDIIHCNDLAPLPIAVLIKKINRNKVKIIYDAHEYETEKNGLGGVKKKLMKATEKLLIKSVDEVITVSNSIAEEYVRLYNIKKPGLVLNCPNYEVVGKHNKFREEFEIEDEKKIFLYQGGLSKGRGLEIILETFCEIDEKAVLVVMGYGPLQDKVIEYTHVNSNIFFHEAVNVDVLLEYTSSADVGLLFYENNCLNHYYCSPNKYFEYMMAGLPVVVNNLFELNRLTKKYNTGWVVEEESKQALRKVINNILNESLREYTLTAERMSEEYSWENQEKVLLNVYKELFE